MSLLQLENITKVYHTGEVDFTALRGVSLSMEAGEFLAIMGASGSGKTTLMNIIGCLDRPTSGSYTLDGRDVSVLSRDDLADVRNEKIGFVFQTFNLLARTSALENVELPMLYGPGRRLAEDERHARAKEALARVGMSDKERNLPTQLSGGQQQRAAIARALVNRPALLLADEPTGNLDSATAESVLTLFQELNDAGLTIVLVTHDPDVGRCAKRIVTIRDGLITSDHAVTDRWRVGAAAPAVPAAREGGRAADAMDGPRRPAAAGGAA